MKGKIWVFLLAVIGVVALGICQKRRPCRSAALAGTAGLVMVNRAAGKLRRGIMIKSALSVLLVTAAQWLCKKGYTRSLV